MALSLILLGHFFKSFKMLTTILLTGLVAALLYLILRPDQNSFPGPKRIPLVGEKYRLYETLTCLNYLTLLYQCVWLFWKPYYRNQTFRKIQGVHEILCFFLRILESLPPLPRQNTAAIGCTKITSQ